MIALQNPAQYFPVILMALVLCAYGPTMWIARAAPAIDGQSRRAGEVS